MPFQRLRRIVYPIEQAAAQLLDANKFFGFLSSRLIAVTRRAPVFIIKGRIKDTKESISILFIGRSESAFQLAHSTNLQIETFSSIGKTFRFQTNMSFFPHTDIVIVCQKRPFAAGCFKEGYLALPYVTFSLRLHKSMEDLVKGFSRRRRRDIRKLRDLGYSHMICQNNEQNLAFFYQKMYLPYLKKRFGKAAKLSDYQTLRNLYRRNGGILFALNKEEPIAGILFQQKGRTLKALASSAIEGDQTLVKELATQAALLFLIKWARNKGITSFNYGSTMPFFKDGIFTYKKEWGMYIEEDIEQPVFTMKINRWNRGTLLFLQQNPFIYSHKNTINGIVLLGHKPTEIELNRLLSNHFLPKLDSLTIVSSSDSEIDRRSKVSSSLQDSRDALASPLANICSSLEKQGMNLCVHEFTDKMAK